jgi:hypothetical protein
MQCVLAVSHSSALLGVFCSDLPMLVQWLAVLVICSSGRHYYVHPALLILNFAASSGNMLGRSQTLVIAADAADTASLRQLRWQLQYADREQDACE